MSRKRQAGIPVDQDTYQAMSDYAHLYGLSLSDLTRRMWSLWNRLEELRNLQPAFPPLQESLDTFMADMEAQADTLDEGYRSTSEQQREAAIAAYQEAHPFQSDGDDAPAECPSCHRQTTKAGLVYLPENEVRCTGCYTLPRALEQYRETFGSEG